MDKLKLNLGCGKVKIEGYDNVDLKDGRNAYPLEVEDGTCDEIRVSHLLEHFPHGEVFNIVKHWVSKLKPDGVLKIAVPDFRKIAQDYIDNNAVNTTGYCMGGQKDDNDYHKAIFDKASLTEILTRAGLVNIKSWNDDKDTCKIPISLNLQGTKTEIVSVKRTVRCVMSTPRVGFTANSNCMIRELAMRGVEVTLGTGAYWHQVLTSIIEQEVEKKPDYILTLDYDTWFTFDHLKKMMRQMEESDADAIVTMQVKREEDSLLLNVENGTLKKVDYDSGLIPIKAGHFGCTLFRTSCFEKIKKPWFLPVPGEDGRWAEGRLDADMYFWKNFIESGCKAYLSTKAKIGHIQQMVTYPGTFDNGFEPVHCYITDVEKGKLPEHIKKELADED